MTALNPDEPLQPGDTIEMGSMLREMGTYQIVQVVAPRVYKTNAVRCGKVIHIRRATHKIAKENGLFVFVEKNSNGRWVRCETGPATEWALNPKRLEIEFSI